MNAEEFGKLYADLFDKAFKNKPEDVEIPSTMWTELVKEVMEHIAKSTNLDLRTEFLNIDFCFFPKESKIMSIAVEHENDTSRRKYNFKKLINVNSPLKVLICYYDEDKEEPRKILNYYKKEYKKYTQSNSELLFILGTDDMLEYSRSYIMEVL